MKLVKIGAKVVKHSSYVTFQPAEVAVSRDLFREIPRLIDTLLLCLLAEPPLEELARAEFQRCRYIHHGTVA